jgi:hypothetical protein
MSDEIEDFFEEELKNYDPSNIKSQIVKKIEDSVEAEFGDPNPEIKAQIDEVKSLTAKLQELTTKLRKVKNIRAPSQLHQNKNISERRRKLKAEMANIQLRLDEIKEMNDAKRR